MELKYICENKKCKIPGDKPHLTSLNIDTVYVS